MKKKKRLFRHLFPSYLLITLISLVIVTWYASNSTRNFFLERTAIDLLTRARLLENQIHQLLGPLEISVIDAVCKKIGVSSGTRFTVILPTGLVVGDSNEDPSIMDNHALRPEIIEARKGNVGQSIRFSSTLQKRMMYVAIPLKEKGKILAVIRAAMPVTAIDQAIDAIQIKIILGGLFISMLAAGISLYVSRRISRPIEKLKQGTDLFARGDLSHRLPGTDLIEIDNLIEALNQMAGQLEDRLNTIVSQKKELAAVLSSMAEGVIAFDVDERIISINQAAARIFGRKPEDLLNRTVQEAVRNPKLQQFVRDALSTSENLECDIIHYHEGERIIYIHSTSLFDSTGHSTGILVVLNDVTQLRQLENMRKDFAANVSHEIKTPLTAIKGFVETIRLGDNEKPEDTERFIGIIEKHVNRLSAIVHDLISLSKIEQDDGEKEIQLQKSPIRNVIQAAVGNCREKAEQKEITIDIGCEKDISAMIDATLLEQAIFNLLDNAINYSDRQNTVQVSVAVQETETIISVQDQGIGIAKEHIPRLFERFYRVDKARSRTLGGTGLGLAIVKHIAQAHGGQVAVESTLGKGSIFSIHLPKS